MIVSLVFAGAAIGAVGRYLFTELLAPLPKAKYKINVTFLINIIGSLILGILLKNFAATSMVYLFIGTGFCGGFTTFSTFNSELMGLLFDKQYRWLLIYGISSYVVGLLAGIVGYLI